MVMPDGVSASWLSQQTFLISVVTGLIAEALLIHFFINNTLCDW